MTNSASPSEQSHDKISILFDQFLREKEFLNGLQQKSLRSYRDAFKAFKKYGNADVSATGVKEFMIRMLQAGLKPKSANSYASGINSFLTWLYDAGHTTEKFGTFRFGGLRRDGDDKVPSTSIPLSWRQGYT